MSPCNSLNGTAVVFVGTVQSIRSGSLLEFIRFAQAHPGSWTEQWGLFHDILQITFAVDESFRGTTAKEITVRINKFMGACGFESDKGDLYFKKGEQYLVYASLGDDSGFIRRGDLLWTTHCSRSRRAKDVKAEIETLRGIRNLAPARVTGTYSLLSRPTMQMPAAQQTITLVTQDGRARTETVRDSGRFAFSGLAPGKYLVSLTRPSNYASRLYDNASIRQGDTWVRLNPRSVEVEPSGCVDIAFNAVPDGHISGIVTNANGGLAKGAEIRLWPDGKLVDPNRPYQFTRADDQGRFDLGPLPPGDYLVAASAPSTEPQKVWFYRGTTSGSGSKPIHLKFAQRVALALRIGSTE